jgi:type II secretory pathway pseudopilin PulG
VTAINVKYLGEYRTEKLGRVKAMRFYLEYINHLGRLQKKSAHRRLQAGFTITEVLLAGLMMLIVVLVAGNGVINLLRSNYRANADSEIQNNLNRTLEFVSDEVRRARRIANSATAITSTKVPTGAQAVLAFQIPDPNNPSQLLPDQIVYYTKDPENGLTGPRVLWRFGPDLDSNGNYITPTNISTWQHSPLTDMLAAPANNPNCPGNFNRIPALGNVDDFYTCVRIVGDQVILNANAQVKMTTNEAVNYSVSTRVFPRAIWGLFLLDKLSVGGDSGSVEKNLPILTVPAVVRAKVIKQTKPCTFTPGAYPFTTSACGVIAAPNEDWPKAAEKGSEGDLLGSPVSAEAGDGIVVHVNGLLNANKQYNDQTVDVYTSDSSSLPPGIDSLANNQILFVLTRTTPPDSYSILVTIEPK